MSIFIYNLSVSVNYICYQLTVNCLFTQYPTNKLAKAVKQNVERINVFQEQPFESLFVRNSAYFELSENNILNNSQPEFREDLPTTTTL